MLSPDLLSPCACRTENQKHRELPSGQQLTATAAIRAAMNCYCLGSRVKKEEEYPTVNSQPKVRGHGFTEFVTQGKKLQNTTHGPMPIRGIRSAGFTRVCLAKKKRMLRLHTATYTHVYAPLAQRYRKYRQSGPACASHVVALK
jgi:hypothetical protein